MRTAPLDSPPVRGRPRPALQPVDRVLVGAIVGLLLAGVVATYTASYDIGFRVFGEATFFLRRQLMWLCLGAVGAVVMYRIDYRIWRRYSVLIMAANLCMLVAILGFGATRFGGQRWITSGGSIQPSELAKLAVIIYIADWLSSKRRVIRDVTLGLVPFAILMGVVCGLVMLQPDFSTAMLIGAVATAMFFAAGADLTQMLISSTVAGTVFVGLMLRAPYRIDRVRVFLDPEADPTGSGYQVIQTLRSIMGGGLTGVGLGQGQQKHILPAPHTDAIFAVLGEELGVLACLVVLGLFAVVAWRGFRIAIGSPDPFAALLAAGVTCWITMQALINIAVVTAVVPFTGIPLPFVSFGGSSLVACMTAVGLLANLSRRIDPARARVYVGLDLRRRNGRSRLSRAHRARRVRP